MRASTPGHWQRFWEQADGLELDDVYGTDGRMVREVLLLGDPAGKRILEVGAGTGRDAVTLARAGAEVLTLDYVAGSLDLTAQGRRHAPASPWRRSAATPWARPFADGTFDVVFHQGLLEHFRDPLPLLRDNVRILKPGGHLVVDVPQTFHYYTLGKQVLIAVDKWFAGWETQFTPAQLEGHVRREGLQVVRSYGDWMVPGLWYRALRKILLTRAGLEAAHAPGAGARPGPPGRALARLVRHAPALSLYTMPTIGVVARKPEARS